MPIALMLLGACGIFQVLFIFLAQFILGVGNYIVVILIPIGTTIALFFGVVIIFESFVQVEKRKKVFPIFTAIFFSTYGISLIFLDSVMAFLISENLAAIISLLIANVIEKKYAKINRY